MTTSRRKGLGNGPQAPSQPGWGPETRRGKGVDDDDVAKTIKDFGNGPQGENRIERVDAIGNVVITTPEEVVRGDEGVYDVLREVATLDGGVRVTRGENQLNGERAEVNLKTGVSRMLPGKKSGGRVKGLFTPDKQDN